MTSVAARSEWSQSVRVACIATVLSDLPGVNAPEIAPDRRAYNEQVPIPSTRSGRRERAPEPPPRPAAGARRAGARARDVTKTPATGLDDSASLSRLSGRRFVPGTPDARCTRLMHRFHPRRRDPHPGPARATRELPARAETRDSSPSRLDGGCSHRAASSRGARSRRSEVVGADVVAVHRFSAPRRAAPGHAPPLV